MRELRCAMSDDLAKGFSLLVRSWNLPTSTFFAVMCVLEKDQANMVGACMH